MRSPKSQERRLKYRSMKRLMGGPNQKMRPCFRKEPQATAQDAGQDEHGEVDGEHPGREGEDLVGDGGEAGQKDGPEVVAGVEFLNALERLPG